MIKKISSLLLIIIVCVFFVSGCETEEKEKSDTSSKVKSVDDLSDKEGTLNCTRDANVDGGTGEFNYVVSYKGEDLTSIYSIEAITSDDEAKLTEYEEAYKKIDSYYVGIDHYNASVKRSGNTVSHIIEIDYEKIDIKKLIELEGEEDNIFVDNKPKLEKYFELAKKLGITCSENGAI